MKSCLEIHDQKDESLKYTQQLLERLGFKQCLNLSRPISRVADFGNGCKSPLPQDRWWLFV